MKATYRIHEYNKAGKPHLKWVVRWKDNDGKHRTACFEKKGEAETFQQQRETELRNQGRESLTFSTPLRVMAQDGERRLAPHGKTIRDAVDYYLAYLAALSKSVPVDAAIAQFINGKETRKKPPCRKAIVNLRRILRPLAALCAGKHCSQVTVEDCATYINAPALSVHGSRVRNATAREFFKWCMEPGRHYTGSNPAAQVALVEAEETPVGILTAEQFARLLEAADSDTLAYVAIGGFAGLRAAEIQRLDWSEVDLEDGFIEVRASKSKTATRRLVKIQPCLRAWIEPLAKKSGPVVPTPNALARRLYRTRHRADIAHWPNNALRHSFASYHLSAFKDAAALALEMGHTTTKQIFAHYRQVVRESQAIQWWNVMPEHPENLLNFAQKNGQVCARDDRRARFPDGKYRPYARDHRKGYQQTTAHYARHYGVGTKVITKWQRIGKPLDDAEAMARLSRGEYRMTPKQHAEIYGVPVDRVVIWRRAGWPLDEVERVLEYLQFRKDIAKAVFPAPQNRAVRVIGLAAKDARASAAGREETRIALMPAQRRA